MPAGGLAEAWPPSWHGALTGVRNSECGLLITLFRSWLNYSVRRGDLPIGFLFFIQKAGIMRSLKRLYLWRLFLNLSTKSRWKRIWRKVDEIDNLGYPESPGRPPSPTGRSECCRTLFTTAGARPDCPFFKTEIMSQNQDNFCCSLSRSCDTSAKCTKRKKQSAWLGWLSQKIKELASLSYEQEAHVKIVKIAKIDDVSGKWPNKSAHEFLWPVRHKIVIEDCSSLNFLLNCRYETFYAGRKRKLAAGRAGPCAQDHQRRLRSRKDNPFRVFGDKRGPRGERYWSAYCQEDPKNTWKLGKCYLLKKSRA